MVQGGTDPEASWLGVRMNRPTQYDLRIQRCVVIAGATFSEDHHDELGVYPAIRHQYP